MRHQELRLRVDSDWVTHPCSKDSVRHPGDGHVCLFGGRPSAEVRGKFPHRVYLRSMRGDGGGWDDESIPPHVRNAAQNIMSAYEGHRSRKLKAGPRTVLPESVRSAFECVRDGMGACCGVGAATLDAGFWNIPPDATFHSFFDQDNIAVARLKMVASLCVIGAAGNRPGFGVDAAKSHWDCLQYERCPGSVPEQDSTMEIHVGDVVSVRLESRPVYSFSGLQHDLWVVREIFVDRYDALRLDCQVLVHPGDHEGHLRGHGQSSFGGLEHKPWPLRLFRERTADMAKAMASDHGRALATANATAMAARHRTHPLRHRCSSVGLLSDADLPPPPPPAARMHAPELRVPQDLALARHGRAGDSRELFLLSDAGQAHMHTVIGLENIRSVARNVRFLRHDEAVPAGGEMYCKFVQHATDYKYTDLLPPQAPRCDDEMEQRPLKLFAGAGGLDHAAPAPGWTVDMCASSCLTIKANKPGEEVFHMGVEEFNAMCCSMKTLHSQLQSESSGETCVRDMAEAAAYTQVKGPASCLKPFIRDYPRDKAAVDETRFKLQNGRAVKAVLDLARSIGSFADRRARRVPKKAMFQEDEKASLMEAITSIAADMHGEQAAYKAEIEALHLDDLFVDVYLPHFMQEYSQIFATAFVSGLQDAETDVPVPAVSHYRTWELTQACVEYLHSCNSVGLIPALHEAVCQAVTQSPRWLADDGLSDTRSAKIVDIVDFRMADVAQRFPANTRSRGFLMQKLMRAETQMFFSCRTTASPEWLSAHEIVARGGKGLLLKYVDKLREHKRLPWPGGVSIILAGPPCQDISAANPHSSKSNVMETDQVRNNMVFPLLDAVECFKPSYIVVEQVPVALSTDKRSYATTVQHQLLTLGYQTHVRLINAEDCGAPQKRLRMFILAAARGKLLPQFPSPIQPVQRGLPHAPLHQHGAAPRRPTGDSDPPGSAHVSMPAPAVAQSGRAVGVSGVGADHKACMWDVVSDLPHVSNGGFLGMINADAISPPRSVVQHYNGAAWQHPQGLPAWLCMILGAGPYMVMAARFLLRMKLTGAELDAASELLTALKAREQVPDTFEKVLGHPVSGTGMCSLRQKVYSSLGVSCSSVSKLHNWRQIKYRAPWATSTKRMQLYESAMDCVALLASKATAERNFCALLCSIAASCPSEEAGPASTRPALHLIRVVQWQLSHAKSVADRALEAVRKLDSEGQVEAAADWQDHDLRGPDGVVTRWSCANRLQRLVLGPVVEYMQRVLASQLQSVDRAFGSTNICTGVTTEAVWVLNHIPIQLSVHEECVLASMRPRSTDFRSLGALAAPRTSTKQVSSTSAAAEESHTQLLVSGRFARTEAYTKKASSYQRPALDAVLATVTGTARVQVNCTDSHPALDRTLTLLELKRCQGFPDDYALLAFPDSVEDHDSGALRLESIGGMKPGLPGGRARNLGARISLKHAFSMLLSLTVQKHSIWSVHASMAKNLWRLVGNAVCVLVARQLREGLNAATAAGSHRNMLDVSSPDDDLDGDARPKIFSNHCFPAVAVPAPSTACHGTVHPEWQKAVELHVAACRNVGEPASQGVTYEPQSSLLRNVYDSQLPDFLRSAVDADDAHSAGSVPQGMRNPGTAARTAGGRYRLPYGLTVNGPEVKRLNDLWDVTERPPPPRAARRADPQGRPAGQIKRKCVTRSVPGSSGAGRTRRRTCTSGSDSETPCASVATSDETHESSSAAESDETSESDTSSESRSVISVPSGAASAPEGTGTPLMPRQTSGPAGAAVMPGACAHRVQAPRKLPRIVTGSRAASASLEPLSDLVMEAASRESRGTKQVVSGGGTDRRPDRQDEFIDLTALSSGEEGAHEAAASPAPCLSPAATRPASKHVLTPGDVQLKRWRLAPYVHRPGKIARIKLHSVTDNDDFDACGLAQHVEVDSAGCARSEEWLPDRGGSEVEKVHARAEAGQAGADTCAVASDMNGPSGDDARQAAELIQEVDAAWRLRHAERQDAAADAWVQSDALHAPAGSPEGNRAVENTLSIRESGLGTPVAGVGCVSETIGGYGYNEGFGTGNEYMGVFGLDSD